MTTKKKETMDEDVTQVSLQAEAPKEAAKDDPFFEEAASIADDVPVKLVAVLGKKNLVLKDLLKFKVGQTIDLERAPNEFVDLVANGKTVARGELVEIDGKLGVRIIKMLK